MRISLIIPIYNEEKNIHKLYETINMTMRQQKYHYELILINDGSSDASLTHLQQIAERDNHFKYISFSRNFGKEAAMFAGLKNCTGDCAIILDADLQHPPEYIPEMITHFEKGYDQVVMRRDRSGEHVFRKIPTQIFYKLINRTVDVKLTDGEGDFRLVSRAVIDSILSLDEYNRFSKGIFEWVGYNKLTIPYKNIQRESGQSSFSSLKLIDYAIDGIISYNNKPLRICFYLGAITMVLCLLYIFITLVQIMTHGIDEPGYFTIISSILFLGALQLFSLGIIGEYIGRIYFETKKRPHYIIQETNIINKKVDQDA
ncbi:glycosyltransferase family 2 protein [Macrococcoides caseolyticum]|uniref:glycosyltransferase family 2 protein n=1 Tax=Macrococcoides caseolyticum TaxID=69966 RepID=UPI001F17B7C0|nr:glycosyltransferase family 2 protein [Macrococcus caseolyticus]MCE4956764.1 glycosyltransferase family 2 protein [Macrococcus caseolyticus]